MVSFSGNKGYHLTAFLDAPTPIDIVISAAKELERRLKDAGVGVCKVGPTGPGLQNMKLPLAIHSTTRAECRLVDNDFTFVYDPIAFLNSVERTHLSVGQAINTVTGEIKDLTHPGIVSLEWPRACLGVLWETGLQQPGTRHSCTCTLATALVRLGFRANGKAMPSGWCERVQPQAKADALTRSDLREWHREADRLWKWYSQNPYEALCHNQVFAPAMRSACADQVSCMLKRNGQNVDTGLLTRMGAFNHGNSNTPGLGKSTHAVYQAAATIRDTSSPFLYKGEPAFALPKTAIQERAGVSRTTVKLSIHRLVDVGLLELVPRSCIPDEVNRGSGPWQGRVRYYVMPNLLELSHDELMQIADRADLRRFRARCLTQSGVDYRPIGTLTRTMGRESTPLVGGHEADEGEDNGAYSMESSSNYL